MAAIDNVNLRSRHQLCDGAHRGSGGVGSLMPSSFNRWPAESGLAAAVSYSFIFLLLDHALFVLPPASVNTAVHVENLSCYLTRPYQVEDSVHNVLYICDRPHWLQLLEELFGI